MKRYTAMAALCVALWSSAAHAGGFNIYEMGARATALGGAFTATADDGSALFYNPAGIAWLPEGWQVSGNLSLIMPSSKFVLAEGSEIAWPGNREAETKAAVFPPGGLYVTYRTKSEWSFGLGVFTPFGLGVEWDDPDDFPGRSIATNSQIQGFYVSPLVTWHPVPGIALSGGVHAVLTHLTLERIVTGGGDLAQNLGDFELEGSSEIGFGPAFALMVRPNEKFSFGINFKGGVTNEFRDQDASLTLRSDPSNPTETTVSGDLDYPSILSVGASAALNERLTFMADYVFFDWSVFDKVALDFADDRFDTTLDEGYNDGHQWRFGLSYQATPKLEVMGGFVYDITPQPRFSMTPLLPDADRRDYSLGATYRTDGGYEFTFAYMLVDFLERSTILDGVGQNPEGFDGAYRSIAHIPTFGVTKSF